LKALGSRKFAAIGVLAALYFLAGKLGLALAVVHASVSAVWPATGIALAAFLVLGYDAWPGILLGAFLVNLTTAGSVATSVGIAIGDTLEGFVGAYLVNRFAHGRNAFLRTQDIFKFTFFGAVLSSTIAATIGVTSLSLGGYASWANYRPLWLTWWQGDTVGAIIVTPLLLLWIANPRVRWNWDQIAEATALLTLLVLVGMTIFGGLLSSGIRNEPTEFLCIPFLIWAALRFGPREAATAIATLAGIAIWGTMRGNGPFVLSGRNESLLLLQAFMGVVVIMTLVLAAEVAERKDSMEQIRQMALSDPLTGLANYRRLVEVLDSEITRYGRTGRPFSVLVLDLDGLKKINDLHGHIVGSQALCRLADVLRARCRATDVAARYGGDEFVVVLPESEDEGAQNAAWRIQEHVANNREEPRISVSVGAAVYPRDGETISELLSAADRVLYERKAEKGLEAPAKSRRAAAKSA
jgi:diguanylate cyclase (GGDEF)-like protein